MAAEVPDLQTLKSWEEAFQFPVITTRRIEQQLRGEVAANKEKLRTLVGASYRDLLGTAETIVEMDKQMRAVDTNLTLVSRNCNLRTLERKSGNTIQLQKQSQSKNVENQAFAAQLSLLRKCQLSISRLLRKHGSLLLAAKILVVSRLLHKTLSTSSHRPPFLETLRNQLSSLRRSLLKRIERSLAGLQVTVDDLVEALCAFCLATSSTSSDAVRHFHHLRMEEITAQTLQAKQDQSNILHGLGLYVRTLQDTTALLGRKFSDALSALRNRPLIEDSHIQSLESLNLSMYQSWLAADVQNFTPWIKLHELTKTEAKSVLETWSQQAFDKFITSVNNGLKEISEIEDLLNLRRQVMETWLPFHHSAPTHSAAEVLKGLQGSINHRLTDLMRSQAEGLQTVVQEASSSVNGWSDANAQTPKSLWDSDLIYMDASDGAATLKSELKHRQLGNSAEISRLLDLYESWLSSIRRSQEAIQTLRRSRWEDLLEEEDDDELDGLSISQALSKHDPDLFEQEQSSSVRKSLVMFQEKMQDLVSQLKLPYEGKQAAFILRIIRGVRQSTPLEGSRDQLQLLDRLIPRLHQIIASETFKPVLPLSIGHILSKKSSLRTLWEGEPPLPVQPSPATFKLLRRVTMAMSRPGLDLWSPAAIDIAKHILRKAIREEIGHLPEAQPNGAEKASPDVNGHTEDPGVKTNGDSDTVPPEAREPTILSEGEVQSCFDLCYLDCALAVRGVVNDTEQESLVSYFQPSANIEESSMRRMQKAASDYWNRTSLLFGLLA